MGASPAEIAAVVAERGEAPADTAPDEAQGFDVEPDNWDSWLCFMALSTQWVWAAMGMEGARRVGLNHCAIESGLRLQGVPRSRWPALYEDLRLIERAVLVADGELLARERQKRPRRGAN